MTKPEEIQAFLNRVEEDINRTAAGHPPMHDDEGNLTAFGEAQLSLAAKLHSIPYGDGAWQDADELTMLNYMRDASIVLFLMPHLLGLGERERLASLGYEEFTP